MNFSTHWRYSAAVPRGSGVEPLPDVDVACGRIQTHAKHPGCTLQIGTGAFSSISLHAAIVFWLFR